MLKNCYSTLVEKHINQYDKYIKNTRELGMRA